MQVKIELYVNNALFIMHSHFVALKVPSKDKILEESYAEDVFGFFGTILGGKRFAALGRKQNYDHGHLMGRIFEANVASPIEFLFIDPEDEIKLIVETNIWLDPGVMAQEVSIKISSDKKTFDIPLNSPRIKMDWASRGTFAIDIGDFIKELNAERMKI